MSAKDLYHSSVKRALEKDGWMITDDPLSIRYGKNRVEIDLGAEKLIGASKGNKKIAVEIRSFLSASILTDFHNALGQILVYKLAIQKSEPERILYLAISFDIHKEIYDQPLILDAIKVYGIKLIVFSHVSEEVKEWID